MDPRRFVGRFAERRPNVAILIGRAFYQAGAFAAIVFPAVALTDVDARRVVVPLTVSTLVVASVLVALQIGIVRLGVEDVRFVRSYQINVVVGLSLVAAATGLSWLLTGRDMSALLIGALYAIGSLGLSSSMLSATRLSVAGRKAASAVTEALCGMVLVVGSGALVIARTTTVMGWAVGFLLMGATCAVIGLVNEPPTATTSLNELVRDAGSAFNSSRSLIIGGAIMAAFNRADYLLMDQLASATESNRYVIATRLSAPIMAALSALNNSLFVEQAAVRNDIKAVATVTERFAAKMMKMAGVVTVATIVAVIVIDRLVPALAERHVVGPAAILAVAALLFASAVPWSFALTSIGRETLWNRVLAMALAVDLIGVGLFSRYGAIPVALCWLATQVVVVGLVYRFRRVAGL